MRLCLVYLRFLHLNLSKEGSPFLLSRNINAASSIMRLVAFLTGDIHIAQGDWRVQSDLVKDGKVNIALLSSIVQELLCPKSAEGIL